MGNHELPKGGAQVATVREHLDAIKEFSIRSIDGSKGTKEEFAALGFSGKEAMSIFAEGGEDAEYAFQIVLKELIAMEDQVKRDEVGVALFGTMFEDLGVDAIASLANVQGGLYDTEDALGKINAVKYDSLDAAMEGIKRNAEVQLIPAAEAVTDAFIDIAPRIEGMVNLAMPYIVRLAEGIGPCITNAVDLAERGFGWLAENGEILLPIVSGLTAAFVAYKAISAGVAAYEVIKTAVMATGATTVTAASVATWALNGALAVLTSPITLVILAIGALVAAGVWLYQNWDLVKEKAAQLGEWLSGVWDNISTAASNLWQGLKDGFYNAFSSLGSIIKGPINTVIGIVNGAIDAINGIGFSIPDWVPLIGGKKFAVNIPNLPMLYTGGHTDGVSIAGERGMETVISYDPAYRSENLSYWAEAGRMLGADWSDFTLGGGSDGDYYDFSGVTFAPNITIQGNADKRTIMDAIEDEYPEFCDMLERFIRERGKPVYA